MPVIKPIIKKVGIEPTGTKQITANGEYDVKEFANAKVNVPTPEGHIKPEGTLAITKNGKHDVTNYAEADVNVPIPDGYVVPSGNVNITTNGTHNVSGKATATVNVPSDGEYDITTEENKTGTTLIYEYKGDGTNPIPSNITQILRRVNGTDYISLDVSNTTATASTVCEGFYFTDAEGNPTRGTYKPEVGYKMSLSDDGTVLSFVHGNAAKEFVFYYIDSNDGDNSGSVLAEPTAKEGMTWAEWIESGYNTYGWYVYTNYIVTGGSGMYYTILSYNGTLVLKSDVIIDEGIYEYRNFMEGSN